MLDEQFMRARPSAMPGSQGQQSGQLADGIIITKLLMIDTGTYNQMYRRPYETDTSANTINTIRDRVEGRVGFTPASIGGIAGTFISPSPTWEAKIGIANGWDVPRFRFVMEVEYRFGGGMSVRELITGSTSHVGAVTNVGTANIHGQLDPEMTFKINNIIKLRTQKVVLPTGGAMMRTNVSEASHLLSNAQFDGVFTGQAHETRLRPADMFAIMSRNHLELGGNTFDNRSNATRTPVKSRRGNGNPARYLSDIMGNYTSALVAQNSHADTAQHLATARGYIEEQSVKEDKFLTAIRAASGNQLITDSFKWKDLMRLQPSVDQLKEVRLLSPKARAEAHQTGRTNGLGGSGRIDVIIAMLAQSIPAIMLDFGITFMTVHATNKMLGGHNVAISNLDSLTNENMAHYGEAIKQMIITEALNDISYNNDLPYDIHLTINVFGDSKLSLNVGNDFGEAVIPSFADGSFAPLITADQLRSTTIASHFETLMSEVIDHNAINHTFLNNRGDETMQGHSYEANRPVSPFQL